MQACAPCGWYPDNRLSAFISLRATLPVATERVRAGRQKGELYFMDVLPRAHDVSSPNTEAPAQPGTPVHVQQPAARMYPAETQPLYPSVTEQFVGPMSPPEITGPTWGAPPPTGGYQPGAPNTTTLPTGPQSPPPRRRWIYAVSAVLFLALILASFAVGHAMIGTSSSNNPSNTTTVIVPPSATDLQQTLIDVAKAVQPSVVEVTSLSGNSEAIGSGVILSKDGYIVTNDHVVSSYTSFTVTLADKTAYQAQVVGQDAQDDLAVLKIAASNLTPITFANSDQLQVGQFAVAIGSPLGLEESTTFGIVSALNRAASEAPYGPASELAGLIQTSAAINPGNSGGALVNLQGQLIGMPTLGATNTETNTAANDIGFAIPSNRIKYVADQLIQNGHLTSTNQGFLGIQGQDVAANGASTQQGVRVMGFADDASGTSPAQQAGIQQGDVIIAVNGQAVTGNDDLAGALLTQKPGTQVKLTILRGTAQQTVTVTLGERPVGN